MVTNARNFCGWCWALSGAIGLLSLGCATAPAPTTPEVVERALPEATQIPQEWSAETEDTGYVDDGWIESFEDRQLEALVEEALANNLDLRIASSQVDRAAALARIAGSELKPMVGLGADIAETSRSIRAPTNTKSTSSRHCLPTPSPVWRSSRRPMTPRALRSPGPRRSSSSRGSV